MRPPRLPVTVGEIDSQSPLPPNDMPKFSVASVLVRSRYALFALAIAVTIAGIGPSRRLEFEQSIESFYAKDNPRLLDYLESRSIFGGDEFVVVAFEDPRLFDDAGRLSEESDQQIRELAERLSRIPGVRPASTQHLPDALAVDRIPLLASQRESLKRLVEGVLLGTDRQTTAILLRLMPVNEAPVPRGQTIAEIRQLAANFSRPTYITGEPVLVHDTFRYVEEDGAVLGWVSTGLLVLVIAVLFRRLRWVVLPVIVVEATIIWTKASLVLSRLQLSMVSSMLNSLLTVVGIATVIHVIVRFREHRQVSSPIDSARQTFQDLGHAIFWTTATTAAGFAAQMTSHVVPVQSFGLMTATGTMLVLIAVTMIMPAGLLIGKTEKKDSAGEQAGRIAGALAVLSRWLEQHPLMVAAATGCLAVVSLVGMMWLRVETDFSKNFRENTPVVQGLNFVETQLGGGSVWEVNFAAPQELDSDFLDRVRKLAERLRSLELHDQPQLTKVMALTDGVDLIPLLPLPAKRALLQKIQPEFESSLYQPQQGRMRIVLRARERQPSEDRQAIIHNVEAAAREEFPSAKVSGMFVLLTFLIDSLLEDQWVSLATGAVIIIAMMAVAFRSVRIGLVSLVPNLLPILLVIGTMGWAGVPINLGTAMISSVSLGLTVDSSIHYFTGYFRARRQGADTLAAIRETNQGVGSALIYTNLALIAGFLVLMLSHFMPLVYFGVLVSAAMIGGLIGNLLLLPLLIRAFRI